MKINRSRYPVIVFLSFLWPCLYAQNDKDNREVDMSLSEKDIDWSRVFNDSYYFSNEKKEEAVIIFAGKDTTISVWLNGVRDTAKYERTEPYYFESWDNGVTYYIRCYKYGQLNIDSDDQALHGLEYRFDFDMKANIFGQANFYSCNYFKDDIDWTHLTATHIMRLNNIAYYFQQIKNSNCNHCAISILEKLVKIAPKRVVAYLNLADAYWYIEEKNKAIENYNKYIELMKEKGWEGKIPKKVIERLSHN